MQKLLYLSVIESHLRAEFIFTLSIEPLSESPISINRSTPNVKIAEITWFSVRDDINRPIEINTAPISIKPIYTAVITPGSGFPFDATMYGKTSIR